MKDNKDNFYQKMKQKNIQSLRRNSNKEKNKKTVISRTNKNPPSIIKNILLSKTQTLNTLEQKNLLSSYSKTLNKDNLLTSQSGKKVNIKLYPTKKRHLIFPPEKKLKNLIEKTICFPPDKFKKKSAKNKLIDNTQQKQELFNTNVQITEIENNRNTNFCLNKTPIKSLNKNYLKEIKTNNNEDDRSTYDKMHSVLRRKKSFLDYSFSSFEKNKIQNIKNKWEFFKDYNDINKKKLTMRFSEQKISCYKNRYENGDIIKNKISETLNVENHRSENPNFSKKNKLNNPKNILPLDKTNNNENNNNENAINIKKDFDSISLNKTKRLTVNTKKLNTKLKNNNFKEKNTTSATIEDIILSSKRHFLINNISKSKINHNYSLSKKNSFQDFIKKNAINKTQSNNDISNSSYKKKKLSIFQNNSKKSLSIITTETSLHKNLKKKQEINNNKMKKTEDISNNITVAPSKISVVKNQRYYKNNNTNSNFHKAIINSLDKAKKENNSFFSSRKKSKLNTSTKSQEDEFHSNINTSKNNSEVLPQPIKSKNNVIKYNSNLSNLLRVKSLDQLEKKNLNSNNEIIQNINNTNLMTENNETTPNTLRNIASAQFCININKNVNNLNNFIPFERYYNFLGNNNITNNITKGNVITTNLINIYSNDSFNLSNNICDINTFNKMHNISNNNSNIINYDSNIFNNNLSNNLNNNFGSNKIKLMRKSSFDLEDINLNNNIENKINSASINIEDLIIFQEKLKDIMIALNRNKIMCNECFEFWNYYYNCSIYSKLEKLFLNTIDSNIIRISINFELMSIMLCYDYSFNLETLTKSFFYLFQLLKLNYMNLMIICEHILNKISHESLNNIWVHKLRIVVDTFNLDCNEYNKIKEYNNMSSIEKINNNINTIIQLLKYILQNFQSSKNQYLTLFFSTIRDKTYEEINTFFRDYILRIGNINGSILASQFLRQNTNFKTVLAPYVHTKNNKNFSLVLDLDETLIHFKAMENGEDGGILRVRPGVNEFLAEVGKYYELILFTTATQDYADVLVDNIEEDKIYFEHRLYREHAVIIDNDFVKDLSRIGRPLDKIIIVDNMPQNFRLQKENGIMIKAFWGEDNDDTALFSLGPILVNIAKEGGDLRNGLAKYKDDIVNNVSSLISKE